MLKIKHAITSFGSSHRYLWQDRVNFIFTTMPILLGIVLYYYLGRYTYTRFMGWGQAFIDSHIGSAGFADFVSWMMVAILTVFLFFLVNWTFVMVVSLIASPFNDLISERIEKKMQGQKNVGIAQSFSRLTRQILSILWNELKKVLVIGCFTVLALLLSFFPLMVPLSMILTALLVASQFADYSWSRHNWGVKKCIGNVRKNFLSYLLVGGFFLFLISIPVVNLIVPAWATSYFTILWVRGEKKAPVAS